jgi:hypothetical protein
VAVPLELDATGDQDLLGNIHRSLQDFDLGGSVRIVPSDELVDWRTEPLDGEYACDLAEPDWVSYLEHEILDPGTHTRVCQSSRTSLGPHSGEYSLDPNLGAFQSGDI